MKRLTILAAIPLAACGGGGAELPQQTPTGILVQGPTGAEAEVQEIILKDGTHCAVLIGIYKSALSCGWRQ